MVFDNLHKKNIKMQHIIFHYLLINIKAQHINLIGSSNLSSSNKKKNKVIYKINAFEIRNCNGVVIEIYFKNNLRTVTTAVF